jgi:hypothetical protein
MGSRVRVPPRSPCPFSPIVFSKLSRLFVKPAHRFDTSCSLFGFRDQRLDAPAGHPLLVGGDRITLHFAEALVARYCRNDVGAASGFCQTPTSRLAKPVGGRSARKARSVTGLAEPIGEARRHERLTKCRS